MTKANLSLNGIAGTLWEIRRQECVHWYLGYRQSILIINSLTKALKEAELSRLKILVEIDKKKKVIGEDNIDFSGGDSELAIFALELEIAEDSLKEQAQMVRDSKLELETAQQEKSRIEVEHPEIGLHEYQELQEKYAKEAFANKLIRSVTISAFGYRKLISEGAAEVIYDARSFTEQEQIQFADKLSKEMLTLMPEEFVLNNKEIQPSIPELASSNTDFNLLEGSFKPIGENNGFVFRGN